VTATERLHERGQSIWLDNITREMLDSDQLQAYIDDYSVSTKDPKAPDDLYLQCLGAPFTVTTVPEATLRAFHDHGHVGTPMPADGGDSEATLADFTEDGVEPDALAAKLQSDGAKSFVDSWNDLIAHIDEQSAALRA
jgi:transaldolase